MARQYWLLKTEPDTFSFDDLRARERETWDGVRNYQARNNLQAMRTGDLAFVYHSVGPREVVGVAKVVREAHPDPTVDDARWVAVEVSAVCALEAPVPLSVIKEDPQLQEIALVRHSRLSVMPLRADEFERILELGRTRLPKRIA